MAGPVQARPPTSGSSRAPRRAHAERSSAGALVLAALGVVFGDIGTSPLYALQTVFALGGGAVRPVPVDVYGVVSLVFWSVTLLVSVKYIGVVMRADNDGEGGVIALTALVHRALGAASGHARARAGWVVALGILGASLFYGDSLITPAISVLSAVEGLEVARPELAHLVLPLAVAILAGLFAVQRFGTSRVGALFGPVMVVWFVVLGLLGLREVVRDPSVVRGLSPTYALAFVLEHPGTAFVAMGAVVLCVTGAEALYADMGHFGRPPIARAWFGLVFPALVLQYLGQAALILRDPTATRNPFYLLVPDWALLPMVLLATLATVIASQAVIAGAFSITRQAVQLGLLPRLTVRQTSEQSAGQVYLPAVNAALFLGVLVLVLAFESSQRLATAYGVAVTGALLVDTVLLLVVAHVLWHWSPARIALAGVAFGGVELLFFTANLPKVPTGGWLPVLVAVAVFTVMSTWQRGREVVTAHRTEREGRLDDFLAELRTRRITRVPGSAVFPHPTRTTTPLALRANVEANGVLHEHVAIVSTVALNVPHVPRDQRVSVEDLGSAGEGVVHVVVRHGFSDRPLIPAALRWLRDGADPTLPPALAVDPDTAIYFVSRASLRRTSGSELPRWRAGLFVALAHNAADPAVWFGLPAERTVVMGSQVDV